MHLTMQAHNIRVAFLRLSVFGIVGSMSVACSSEESRASVAPAVRANAASRPARELNEAMDAFTRALRASDIERILQAFSQFTPWNALDTRSEMQSTSRVSYEKLSEALKSDGQLHDSFLGDRDTSLRCYVTGKHDKDWEPLNPYQFAPPGVAQGSVWIAWRQEAGRWVVDTLAWPMR
jgi:hypothetical protein